jgi:hypothetical protein
MKTPIRIVSLSGERYLIVDNELTWFYACLSSQIAYGSLDYQAEVCGLGAVFELT